LQSEYYFSLNNLLKDVFLRRHMDSQGFVRLPLIASFKRVEALTKNIDVLRSVCIESDAIEFRRDSDGGDHIRAKKGWEKMVLEMEERDPSARNDGPKEALLPETCLLEAGEGERRINTMAKLHIRFGDLEP
jgi:la-related protein 1